MSTTTITACDMCGHPFQGNGSRIALAEINDGLDIRDYANRRVGRILPITEQQDFCSLPCLHHWIIRTAEQMQVAL